MFKYLMGFLFLCSIYIVILSRSEKDYENCVKLHGDEFANRRKRKLRILGPMLLVFTGVALLLDLFGALN